MEENFEPVSRSSELIEVDNCFIMIIDVQSTFMKGITNKEQLIFLQKFTHLIRLSGVLNIPLIITAEDIKKNGSLPDIFLDTLPSNTKIFDKYVYSCWGQRDIQVAIRNTHRQIAVLCGFETDVCIAQTAIDLQSHGFLVVILTDMTFSRNNIEHEIGLKRMEHHGVIFSLLKTWQEEITAGVKTKISQELKKYNLGNI
ncbi:MAG: isochorismatase family protein [Candidatus Heimdallarchaeota archaeon]|nr:MAG: isochorismatase family protein [Candidatus Heimdallarchaeota archaeon]